MFVIGGPTAILVTWTTFTAGFHVYAYGFGRRDLLLLETICTDFHAFPYSTGLCRKGETVVCGVIMTLWFVAMANIYCKDA